EPTAPRSDKHRIETRDLEVQLDPNRPLSSDHVEIIVRRNEDLARSRCGLTRYKFRIERLPSPTPHFCAVSLNPAKLRWRYLIRNEDLCLNPSSSRRSRDAEPMIPIRRR